MIAAGRLSTLLTVWAQQPEWGRAGQLWARVVAPKSLGQQLRTGLRANQSSLIHARANPHLMPARCLSDAAGNWWVIESVASPSTHERIASVREIIGTPATYTPLSGTPHQAVAAVSQSLGQIGAHMIDDTYTLELFTPQLHARPARGDVVELGGVSYRIDGVADSDGVIVRCYVVRVS